tara:strand:- start:27 stop:488 length:462 start_codon:yes stop_codon:yes gene_type:complete
MRFTLTFVGFLVLNLASLFLGTLLMNEGPTSEWYSNLNRAPWEPAGWIFGAAWTCVMVFFSVYLGFLYQNIKTEKVWLLIAIHFVLNVSWNYIFMNKHMVELGLLNITLLTLLMFYFLFAFRDVLNQMRFFVLPYCLWMVLATSLNLYIAIYN